MHSEPDGSRKGWGQLMKIIAKTKFRDGYTTFEKDKFYHIPEDKGQYFLSLGWVAYVGKTPFWRRLKKG
jgi:hypothetical protein